MKPMKWLHYTGLILSNALILGLLIIGPTGKPPWYDLDTFIIHLLLVGVCLIYNVKMHELSTTYKRKPIRKE